MYSDSELGWMRMAVEEANKSDAEDDRTHPKVGAVIVKDDEVIGHGFRGKAGDGAHSEFSVLEGDMPNDLVAGSTVYVTLEPCTRRGAGKIPCADRLVERKVDRVVIGMVDPNPIICGHGIEVLRKGGIEVNLFPRDIAREVEEMNRDFVRAQRNQRQAHYDVHEHKLERIVRKPSEGDMWLVPRLESAKRIRILAVNCETLVKILRASLQKALTQNATLEVLLATKDSELVTEMEKMEIDDGRDPMERSIPTCVDESVGSLRNLAKQTDSTNVWLGHYNTHYRETMIIIDESALWWTPHFNPARGDERISFAWGQKSPLLALAIRHFEAVSKNIELQQLSE